MFVFQTPAGWLVDAVGAKRVFTWSLALTGLGIGLVGFATGYLEIIAFALFAGVGQAGFHPADYALLDAVTDPDQEGKSFGVHTFAGYAGFAAAPFVVGGLTAVFRWGLAIVATEAFGLVYAVTSHLSVGTVYLDSLSAVDANQREFDLRSMLQSLFDPRILILFVFLALVAIGSKGVQTFTNVFVVEQFGFTEAVGNASLTAYISLAAVGVLVGGIVADRVASVTILVAGLTVAAGVAVGMISLVSVPMSAITVLALIGFSVGFMYPARDRLINSLSSDDSTGSSFGFIYTGLALGAFVGPALYGVVIDVVDVSLVSALVGAFFFLGSALVFVVALASRTALAVPIDTRAD